MVKKLAWNLVAVLSVFVFGFSFGQEIAGVPGKGSTPVTVTMAELVVAEHNAPPPGNLKIREEFNIRNPFKEQSPEALPGHKFPNAPDTEIGLFNVTQTIHSNFQGVQLNEANSIPPDCNGGLSHTQICVITNGRIKFYPKPSVCDAAVLTSTTVNTGSLTNPVFSAGLDVFFATVRGNSSVTDPHVYFDRLSERWFVVAINTANASNRIMIAVSNSATISAQSSFSFFFFNHDNGAPANSPDNGSFADYPMVGVDKNALYVGSIIFNSGGTFIGSSAYVVNKASLLAGGTLQFTAFRQVGLVTTGIFAPQGVYNDDPEATRGFFVGVDNGFFGRLRYITVNNPGGASPTITQGTITGIPNTSYPYDQPALGSSVPLDALGDERLLDAQMIRNKFTGQSSVWTAHHIAVNSIGEPVAATPVVAGARNAMRWYQLTENNGVLSLTQSGTLFDNSTTAPRGYWMGTIAASGQGHALLASSVAGTALHANAAVAGRYSSQTQGTLNPPVNVTNFTAVYNRETGGDDQRWGDYSLTVVDPSDDMTIWTFQQYTNATNSWALRATQLKAPPPAVPTSVSPIECDANGNATITLNGSATDFAGFFDPGPPRGGPAYPRRLTVTSTGNVPISAVEVLSPTQIRFMANFSSASLGSNQTLTITNPDCQSVNFNYTLPATCSGGNPTPANTLRVNPNPVRNRQMVVQTPDASGSIRLLAADGKILDSYTVNGGTITINVARYPAGVYFVEFQGTSGKQVLQVFIDRR